MNYKLRDLPPELAQKLDVIATGKGCSRNKLILDILSQYALFEDTFFLNQLPDVTHFLIKNVLGEQEERISRMAEFIIESHLKTVATLQELLGNDG